MRRNLQVLLGLLAGLVLGLLMPDLPDWYPRFPGSERFPMQDAGELAARLGSPVTYDRRGEVLWIDDFGGGVARWLASTTPAGGTLVVDPDRPLYGYYSMHMTSPGSGSNLIEAHRYFSPPAVNYWGAEVGVSFPTDFDTFTLEMDRLTADTIYYAAVVLDLTDAELQILDDSGSFVKVADLVINTNDAGLYHRVKLVADFENNQYVRLLLDQTEYDVSSQGMFSAGSSGGPYNDFYLTLHGRSAQADEAKVGYFIVTANEP